MKQHTNNGLKISQKTLICCFFFKKLNRNIINKNLFINLLRINFKNEIL